MIIGACILNSSFCSDALLISLAPDATPKRPIHNSRVFQAYPFLLFVLNCLPGMKRRLALSVDILAIILLYTMIRGEQRHRVIWSQCGIGNCTEGLRGSSGVGI